MLLSEIKSKLAHRDISGAIALIATALDDSTGVGELTASTQCALCVILARCLATQGHFGKAIASLQPVLPDVIAGSPIYERVVIAQMFCDYARDLIHGRKFAEALTAVQTAERMAADRPAITIAAQRLLDVIVPAIVLGTEVGIQPLEDVIRRTLISLRSRFHEEPRNGTLTYALALLSEWLVETSHPAPRNPSETHDVTPTFAANIDDDWLWAIRFSVALESNVEWWDCWIERSAKSQHWSTTPRASSLMAQVSVAARIELALGKRVSNADTDAERQRYESYHYALERERRSAQALATMLSRAELFFDPVLFDGPIAGVSLLTWLRQLPNVQAVLSAYEYELELDDDDGNEATREAITALREMMSPQWRIFVLRRQGKLEEAISECRASLNQYGVAPEAKETLAALLIEKARSRLRAVEIEEARSLCVEALAYAPQLASVGELLAGLADVRAERALQRNHANFDVAIALAREDLALAPNNRQVRELVAKLLRRKVIFILDLAGHDELHLSDARQVALCLIDAWQFDHDADSKLWIVVEVRRLAHLLTTSKYITKAQGFQEVEEWITQVQRLIGTDSNLQELQMDHTRAKISWMLSDVTIRESLMENFTGIANIAMQVERAWVVDTTPDDENTEWTVRCFLTLAALYQPEHGYPTTLHPYDAGIQLLQRACQLIPHDRRLTLLLAELHQEKAIALLHHHGALSGYAPNIPMQVRADVLKFFADSWTTDNTVEDTALLFTKVCLNLNELPSAVYYAREATRLNARNSEGKSLLVEASARISNDEAVKVINEGIDLMNQGDYRGALNQFNGAAWLLQEYLYGEASSHVENTYKEVLRLKGILSQRGMW